MRLLHFVALLTISLSGSAWAQRFPAVENRVPELEVTEMLQSGSNLKVTVRNVSSRTIRGVSVVLGKHRVDQDWSGLASGGVSPNGTASLTISMAGLSVSGSRHHPAALPPLELSSAVFVDAGQQGLTEGGREARPAAPQVTAPATRAVQPPPRVQAEPPPPPAPEVAAPAGKAPRVEAASPTPSSAPEPVAREVPPARVESAPPPQAEVAVPAVKAPRVETASPTPAAPAVQPPRVQAAPPPPPEVAVPAVKAPRVETASPTPAAAPAVQIPRVQAAPPPPPEMTGPPVKAPRVEAAPLPPAAPPSDAVPQDQPAPAAPSAPPRLTGHAGTHEEGVQQELSHLLALVAPFEADLASPFVRTALRKMIAAAVAEQSAWTSAPPAVTSFDQGQGSAVETFVFGLQAIQNRRDLDDETLRGQVQRFLKSRRQLLNR